MFTPRLQMPRWWLRTLFPFLLLILNPPGILPEKELNVKNVELNLLYSRGDITADVASESSVILVPRREAMFLNLATWPLREYVIVVPLIWREQTHGALQNLFLISNLDSHNLMLRGQQKRLTIFCADMKKTEDLMMFSA